MSARDCIKKKAEIGRVSAPKGKAAFERIDQIRDGLRREGVDDVMADRMAAHQYAAELKQQTAKAKWRLINRVRVQREIETFVAQLPIDDMGGGVARMVDGLNFDQRAIHSTALGMMNTYLRQHHPGVLDALTGKMKKPSEFMDFLRAASGETPKTAEARAMADAYVAATEWLRQKANSYGYSIGKLEWRGVPHSWDSLSIWKELKKENGFQNVFKKFDDALDWAGMINPKTGLEFGGVPDLRYREEFVRGAFDNMIYGRNSKNPAWNVNKQAGALERHRVFKFKSADAWMELNKQFGRMDPHSAMLEEMGAMSRHIAIARRFGTNADAALNYLEAAIEKRGRDMQIGEEAIQKARGGVEASRNMVRYLSGGTGPRGYWRAMSASFFATTRKVLTSAMLGQAIVPSIPSDLNSVRLASAAMGMNEGNFLSTYLGLMKEAAVGGGDITNDLLQMQHIAESIGNPGVTASRIMEEYPAKAWADHMSNFVMRAQGLTAHTDAAKMTWAWSLAGHMHSQIGVTFDNLFAPFRKLMKESGITASDWDAFRQSGGVYTASNGAKFLDPLYWRISTSHPLADDIALKFQSFVERTTELAVPSGSLRAKAATDPAAVGLTPGSLLYEISKAATMFKSFPLAFTMNQLQMFRLAREFGYRGIGPGKGAMATYATDMIVTATIAGVMAMQASALINGRDIVPMNSRQFWVAAFLKGGGLGPAGDLLKSGTTSWGGGIPGYLAGPVAQLGQDAIALTFGNVMEAAGQAMDGDEINPHLFRELMNFMKRYTPGNNLWFSGLAFDRLLGDQLQMLLDPESADALAKAERLRQNRDGNASWWAPGQIAPGVNSPLQ